MLLSLFQTHKSCAVDPRQQAVGQLATKHLRQDKAESLCVRPGAIVETKDLLCRIAEQVKRADVYVGAADCPLEQTPEVFTSIGVHLLLDVGGAKRRVEVKDAEKCARRLLFCLTKR